MGIVQLTAKALRERSQTDEPHTCAYIFQKRQVIEEIAKPQLYDVGKFD